MSVQGAALNIAYKPAKKSNFRRIMGKYWVAYLMLLPAVIEVFIYNYVPMFGVLIAFQDYQPSAGIAGFFAGPWVGLKYFSFLQDPYFWTTVKNTVSIAVFRFFVSFPVPIILALMINELRSRKFQRLTQTIGYLPYFISWVVIAYMAYQILDLETGPVNSFLNAFGIRSVYFMGEPSWFIPIIIIFNLWKSAGWGTIIYFAALSNINPELQESIIIDGAKRYQRIWHIDLPTIRPTIVILLILGMPGLISAGMGAIMPFQNAANMSASNIVEIYILNLGLVQAKYSLSTAIDLVFSAVAVTMILLSNWGARLLGQDGFF